MSCLVKEKILFLDIDGVISSLRNSIVGLKYDPVATLMLKKLQDQIGFKIVVSSAQRINHKSATSMLKRIKDVTGVDLVFHEDWRTVSHPTDYLGNLPEGHEETFKDYKAFWKDHLYNVESTENWRGHQIQQWLVDHTDKDIEYVVIDDSFDLFPIPTQRIVHIRYGESTAGMLMDHYDQVLRLFSTVEEDEGNC